MNRILFILIGLMLLSCSAPKEMTEETFEKNKAICLERAENFEGFTLGDLVLEFGRPVYETTDIANNTTIVFSCVESALFIHYTFNRFGEVVKYEVKRTMLAN